MIDLYKISKAIGLNPRFVMEIGTNDPDKCALSGFIRDGVETLLVEPLPWCVEALRREFPRATVIEAVCGSTDGEVNLYDRGEGSWIEDVPVGCAPDEHPKHSHMKRDAFESKFVRKVKSIRFDTALDGMKPDILAVDIEGAEWMVIGQMRQSRPRLLRAETHFTHSGYRNPDYDRINEYLGGLGYQMIVQDVSDSLYFLP